MDEGLGIDVAEGKGVDLVCQAQDYDAPEGSFDHVISCEAMEHNPHWKASFANMVRMVRPGGLVVMTCATTGRAEHGTTRTSPDSSPLTVELGWNYYRNLKESDFRSAFDFDALFSHFYFGVNWRSFDLYFCGIKRSAAPGGDLNWTGFRSAVDDYLGEQHRLKMCVYRAFSARYLGDAWFRTMRSLGRATDSKLLLYLH